MRESPFISFIIPFYGSVSLLKRCLDSFVSQADGDFEVIVVDDCSPEDGAALVGTYGTRFRYVRQPVNTSAFQARNRGAIEARGEYLVPVDPDDYVLPGLVGELRRQITSQDVDMLIFNVEQDDGGNVAPHWCHYEAGCFTPEYVLNLMTQKKLQWNIWAKAIRRKIWIELLEGSGFGRDVYMNASEDFCIVIPLLLHCHRIKVIDYIGYRYWQNPRSICHGVMFGKAFRAVRDTLEAQRMVMSFARVEGFSQDVFDGVRIISRMIIWWWVRECVLTIRKRFLTRRGK